MCGYSQLVKARATPTVQEVRGSYLCRGFYPYSGLARLHPVETMQGEVFMIHYIYVNLTVGTVLIHNFPLLPNTVNSLTTYGPLTATHSLRLSHSLPMDSVHIELRNKVNIWIV